MVNKNCVSKPIHLLGITWLSDTACLSGIAWSPYHHVHAVPSYHHTHALPAYLAPPGPLTTILLLCMFTSHSLIPIPLCPYYRAHALPGTHTIISLPCLFTSHSLVPLPPCPCATWYPHHHSPALSAYLAHAYWLLTTMLGVGSRFCHNGATCDWLLTNLIPALSCATASRPAWTVKFVKYILDI